MVGGVARRLRGSGSRGGARAAGGLRAHAHGLGIAGPHVKGNQDASHNFRFGEENLIVRGSIEQSLRRCAKDAHVSQVSSAPAAVPASRHRFRMGRRIRERMRWQAGCPGRTVSVHTVTGDHGSVNPGTFSGSPRRQAEMRFEVVSAVEDERGAAQ